MEQKVIPVSISMEQHNQIVNDVKNGYESNLKERFEESLQMAKDVQCELQAERNRSDLFRAVAYLEKACLLPELSDFQMQLRPIIDALWNRADSINKVKGVPDDPFGKLAEAPPKYSSHVSWGDRVNETTSTWSCGGAATTLRSPADRIAETTGMASMGSTAVEFKREVEQQFGGIEMMSAGSCVKGETKPAPDVNDDDLRPEYDLSQLKRVERTAGRSYE